MKAVAYLAIPVIASLLAAGCGSDGGRAADESLPPAESTAPVTDAPADELAADRVVFVWTELGGCAMGGPNCARYEVTVDGTVATTRAGVDVPAEPEVIGQVDPSLVQAWRDALTGEDLDALRERVGEGELTAAFDGVDYTVANPAAEVELSSVATAFDRTEPVFAAAFALAQAAADAAPLEMQMR